MTKQEKKIRQEWFDFKHKQNKQNDEQRTLDVQQILKSMFGRR